MAQIAYFREDHFSGGRPQSLFSKSPTTAWYTGSNIPGKARGGLLMYLGPGSVYIERCNDAARNGYEGFVFEEQLQLQDEVNA